MKRYFGLVITLSAFGGAVCPCDSAVPPVGYVGPTVTLTVQNGAPPNTLITTVPNGRSLGLAVASGKSVTFTAQASGASGIKQVTIGLLGFPGISQAITKIGSQQALTAKPGPSQWTAIDVLTIGADQTIQADAQVSGFEGPAVTTAIAYISSVGRLSITSVSGVQALVHLSGNYSETTVWNLTIDGSGFWAPGATVTIVDETKPRSGTSTNPIQTSPTKVPKITCQLANENGSWNGVFQEGDQLQVTVTNPDGSVSSPYTISAPKPGVNVN
jgi:hypothetical protein